MIKIKYGAAVVTAAALLMTSAAVAKTMDDPIDITTVENNSTVTAQTINIGGKCYNSDYLLINGSPVEMTEDGYFSVIKSLKPGENTFVLNSQGYTENLTVFYNEPVYLDLMKQQYKSDEEKLIEYSAGKNFYAVITTDNAAAYSKANTKAENIAPGCCKGTAAQIKGETESFYLLENNTFVNKKDVQVKEGKTGENIVKDIRCKVESSEKMSEFTLKMSTPVPYKVIFGSNYADLVLYNTKDSVMPVQQFICPLVYRINRVSSTYPNSTAYRFYFNDISKVWGYNVSYDQNNVLTLGFRIKQEVSEKTLNGAVVVVNTAAASGNTIGTVTGSQVNKNIAQSLVSYLEKKGAEVHTTGIGGEDLSQCISEHKPDLVVTVSTLTPASSVNSSAYSGLTVYSTYDSLNNAAEKISEGINLEGQALANNGTAKASLAAARFTDCPAVQISYGCMMNVKDYDYLSKEENTVKLGEMTGAAVEGCFRNTVGEE